MAKNVHVTKKENGWSVKTAGSEKAVKITPTQKEAIAVGKSIAQNQKSELIIHRTDGKIREKNSYGNDSYPPKG
ncbi:MAG: DUF2188 domain-containing protein [Bacteroidia bacterium]|nr:DUF2188 domain-containing protein [Bacteroidia bacterium]